MICHTTIIVEHIKNIELFFFQLKIHMVFWWTEQLHCYTGCCNELMQLGLGLLLGLRTSRRRA